MLAGVVRDVEDEAKERPGAQANGYHEVWCDDSETTMPIYYR
ncbi:hypothetical protein [Streptomyces chrestomyceticus]|nr:hypothetical protein [Streptomyces chrestomyceticus]